VAKSSALGKLVTYGALAFVGVEVAAGGLLGSQLQQAGTKLANRIGLKIFISPPGSGTPPGPGKVITPAVPAPSGCNSAFIEGVQYVARLADGTFQVVVKGQPMGNYTSQSIAEGVYNSLVCPKS